MAESVVLHRRALMLEQDTEHPLYMFALSAAEILQVADVSRVTRDDAGNLIGYQRAAVRNHVLEILEYLDSGSIVFPNAVILALGSDVSFTGSRGPAVHDGCARAGTISIPIRGPGQPKVGWIVDGQQRAVALSMCVRPDLPVPVCAFVADDVSLQRDQFLRVNNTKPLPRGLVAELLPQVTTQLPSRLAARKVPSALCDLLNNAPESPFKGLIRRASTSRDAAQLAPIADTSIVKMLEESLGSPSGALFPYRNVATNELDGEAAWTVLMVYWTAVRDTFPEAWGLAPTESRLMHGAGIRAMGKLMDRIMPLANPRRADVRSAVHQQLAAMAPQCHWTSGEWDELPGLAWNEIENTPRHIKMLTNVLIRLHMRTVGGRA